MSLHPATILFIILGVLVVIVSVAIKFRELRDKETNQ